VLEDTRYDDSCLATHESERTYIRRVLHAKGVGDTGKIEEEE
jgi:hypothetical protein